MGHFRSIRFSIVVCMCCFLFASVVHAGGYDRGALIAKFDSLDTALNNGEGYSTYTNEAGTLAWAESYLLEAYLDIYGATSDMKYLNKFVRHANCIIENTDKNRNIPDYKGRVVDGWGATKYSSNNERVVWLVHSGMITYPLVRFALLVKKDRLDQFQQQARSYVTVAKQAMAFFDPNWVYDSAKDNGYYQFEASEPHSNNTPDPPMPVPFNHQLAAGRTLLMLYNVTGELEYYRKAHWLAKHFRNYLIKESNGSYVWHYWYGKGYDRSKAVEDISHGAIDLDFAVLAYRNRVVFNRVDMTRFVQTYNSKIRKNGQFADTVDGKGKDKYKDALGRWLELSEFTSTTWKDFAGVVSSESVSKHPQVMLGIAKLIKYDKKGNR